MCGLTGVAGDINMKAQKAFHELFYTSFLRGTKGAGVCGIETKLNSSVLLKRELTVFDLMAFKEFDNATSMAKNIILGHARAPTVGANTKHNAQPFRFDHLIGTHNGTIKGAPRYALKDQALFETDSEALWNNIDEYGIEETIAKMEHGSVDCAYALVWYDKITKKLHMLRNDQRTLFYALSKDHKTLFWASESPQLHWILGRNGIDYDKVYWVPADTLMTWDIPESWSTKIKEPDQTHMKAPEKKAPAWSSYPQKATQTVTTFSGGTASNKVTKLDHITMNFKEYQKKGKKWKPPYRSASGVNMNMSEFNRITLNNECIVCNQTGHVAWGDFCLFLRPNNKGEDRYICQDCCQDEQMVMYARQIAMG